MQTHSFSTVLYDVSWSDVGSALDAVERLDSDGNIDLNVTHDTSGGRRDDGTTFDTETRFSARYNYALGDGAVALDTFASQLSEVPALPSDTSALKDRIRQRG